MRLARMICTSALLGGLAVGAGWSHAQENCGDLHNHYGPFDYWTDKDKLGIVEAYHFTPNVATLRTGESGSLGGDIDYTLRAFPNHPRALMAMMRLGQKEHTTRPRGAKYSVVCYLERAIRFRPEDATAQMIYGTYLARQKKPKEALEHLEEAQKLAGDDPNLHYNLGLVYADLGEYDKALAHAHIAYRRGFNLPGLRARLERAGKWQDPPPVQPAAENGSEAAAIDALNGKTEEPASSAKEQEEKPESPQPVSRGPAGEPLTSPATPKDVPNGTPAAPATQ